MRINKSPWIHQLDSDREVVSLGKDLETDITIVGAGIAGVSTAFFILKNTNQRVVLLDQGKLAHGATGHNAGQVIAHFERPLDDMVKEFGFEMMKDALQALHYGWVLIEEMYDEAKLDILFSRTKGHFGFSDLNQVLIALKNVEIETLAELPKKEFLISETAPYKDLIPSTYKNFYKLVPQSEILKRLESEDGEFNAVLEFQGACMNSALFCQEIVSYLIKKYPKRFSLYENTRIAKTILKKNRVVLDAMKHTIDTHRVVLCTNGFENIEIYNEGGLEINKWFHHSIEGKIGYMSGYLENQNKQAAAIGYFTEDIDPNLDEPYFYLTRRQHEIGDQKHNLVCLGGPEVAISDRVEYMKDYEYPDNIQNDLDKFISKVYDIDPNRKLEYKFTWHGLMGYTPNRVRLIGVEPKNPVLMYNVGCNGIGIIPSIYGGYRISQIVAGEKLKSSIFDPKNH